MTTLRVKAQSGNHVPGWTFGTFAAVQLISGHKPRKIVGWQITSPDGCERFSEGNWQQFVPFAQLVISNYGYTTNIS
jgi:hypothetical protein